MKILIFALVGVVAQLIDGALGMAFGVTSTTLLILSGVTPAHASASVHIAEIGTTFFSGLSHWRLKNVHWPTVLSLGVPGAIGAFCGAYLLSNLSTESAEPVVSTLLVLLGAYVLVRFVSLPWKGGIETKPMSPTKRARTGLGVLGLMGGMLDATGGGGWGPVTTSTLMSVGKSEPRRIIGTVNTAEFLVTAAAVAGFIFGMGDELTQNWRPVLGLLIGGAIAAPIAAWVVTVVKPRTLGMVVGTLLIVLNGIRLVNYFGVAGVVVLVAVGLAVLFALVRLRTSSLLEGSLNDDADSEAGAAGDSMGKAAGQGQGSRAATSTSTEERSATSSEV
ncbi:sulfite exporter TauE/SafE family protein [Corynebacterium sp. 320]|nr:MULTISPECIES: sulfite exporter TauE/SafE family protein [Corynebacterium]KAB1503089.1 sulfite exporter TauE/SafE family protein [Corynebacterium sp. 320]KAB1551059.1 sulfite exporter TauE/SafE family protein [Corynebacterium sp. 319]KAB3526886.1 sulfite exporter TauE/SafE family protein [Corynebacterium sp. 250]KAB3538379.1 sulfite exporter TauE/SafE family protein [Corynebacterium sp. 366]QNP92499.1 sulfite exporter TauE/SafE family protein [Corynebacterium zhongnanshanii]